MFIRIFLLGAAIVILCAGTSAATDVQLTLSVDQATHTWRVGMIMADTQNLGLASYSIDVLGSGGISILQAADPSQTNAAPSVFNLFRTNGTISGTSLIKIQASQDTVSAAVGYDDSLLGYGYGLPAEATGIFKGPITPQSITLAQGRWSSGSAAANPAITARLTETVADTYFFNEFPLNWDVGDFPDPAGATQSTFPADIVAPVTVQLPLLVPEPSTLALLGLATLGFPIAVRCRRRLQIQSHRNLQ